MKSKPLCSGQRRIRGEIRMKKIIGMLLVLMLISGIMAALAEETDSVTVEESSMPGMLSCTESAVPFCPVQWGMKLKNVVSATGGEDLGNKADVRALVSIPGISGPVPAVFHCGKKGLESVRVTVLEQVSFNGDFKESEEGAALLKYADAFFSDIIPDNSNRITLNSPSSKSYRNWYSDALIGCLKSEQGSSLVMEFFRPIAFDQQVFRKSNRFYMTTESNGDILFFNNVNVMTGFDVRYSKDSQYARSLNVVASKVRLQASPLSSSLSIPCYALVYSYSGTVKPVDVTTMIITVDGTIYSFTDINATPLTVSQYKEYTQQYTVWMCSGNTAFMDALEKSKKTVTVELRGTGFSLVFDLPQKAKAGLVTDWKMFKKANGTDPGFADMTECIATPMTVY